MNKIASIFLTLTFVLYLGGMQLMYWIKIDAARHEARSFVQKNNIESSDSKEFVFTANQYNSLQWSEKSKEFTFKGVRYDIVTATYTTTGVKLICYSDNEETEIVNAFHHFTERLFNTHQQSNSNDNDIISKITKEYISLKLIAPQTKFEEHLSFVITEKNPLLQSPISDIWHPPAIC